MLSAGVVSAPVEAADHYEEQLQWLTKIVSDIDDHQATIITYKDLVESSGRTLRHLTRLLDLKSPLQSTYTTTSYTEKRGTGDPGPHIHAGKIKQNIDRSIDPRVKPFLPELVTLYESFLRRKHDET